MLSVIRLLSCGTSSNVGFRRQTSSLYLRLRVKILLFDQSHPLISHPSDVRDDGAIYSDCCVTSHDALSISFPLHPLCLNELL